MSKIRIFHVVAALLVASCLPVAASACPAHYAQCGGACCPH